MSYDESAYNTSYYIVVSIVFIVYSSGGAQCKWLIVEAEYEISWLHSLRVCLHKCLRCNFSHLAAAATVTAIVDAVVAVVVVAATPFQRK